MYERAELLRTAEPPERAVSGQHRELQADGLLRDGLPGNRNFVEQQPVQQLRAAAAADLGQAASKSGFTVTGGQMWSLVTEDRKGADPRTEIQPQTIDAQYLVGYTWDASAGASVGAALRRL
jgi:hypothetical protein